MKHPDDINMRSYIYMCCVEGEEEEEEEKVEVVVEVTECDNENAMFAMPFNTNNMPSIYQDRLGTNIAREKALKRRKGTECEAAG
eukprot:COSAG06_NODE_5902_length_3221_cov_14.117233_7_plen_85_part_00